MENIVYLNGDFMSLSKAKIPVTDYGFLFGYALFETMRAYNGKIFRLDEHLNRLMKSAELLGIPVDITGLRNIVLETVRRNNLQEARIRITLTMGEGSLTPDTGSCRKPAILVTAAKYIPYNPETYEKGFKVTVSSIHRNSQSPFPE